MIIQHWRLVFIALLIIGFAIIRPREPLPLSAKANLRPSAHLMFNANLSSAGIAPTRSYTPEPFQTALDPSELEGFDWRTHIVIQETRGQADCPSDDDFSTVATTEKRAPDSSPYPICIRETDDEYLIPNQQKSSIYQLKSALLNHSPLDVTVTANKAFQNYSHQDYDEGRPIFIPEPADRANHSVLLVGWDDTVPHPDGKGVWIIQNSWGEEWGKDGYGQIAYGSANIEVGRAYIPSEYQRHAAPQEGFLYHDRFGRGKEEVVRYMNTAYNLVKFVPPQDSCVDRIEFQLYQTKPDRETDLQMVDIGLYDDVTFSELYDYRPANLLSQVKGLEITSGYHAIQLPQPVRLPQRDAIYVSIELEQGNRAPLYLTIDRTTTIISGTYYYKDTLGNLIPVGGITPERENNQNDIYLYSSMNKGFNWQKQRYDNPFNIRLGTTECDSPEILERLPTQTPFRPTLTPTPRPTPTATSALSRSLREAKSIPQCTDALSQTVMASKNRSLTVEAYPSASKRINVTSSKSVTKTQTKTEQDFVRRESQSSVTTAVPRRGQDFENSNQSIPTTLSDDDQFDDQFNVSGMLLLPNGELAYDVPISIYAVDADGNPYRSILFGEQNHSGRLEVFLMEDDYLLEVAPALSGGTQMLKHTFTVTDVDTPVDLGTLILPHGGSKIIQGRVINSNVSEIDLPKIPLKDIFIKVVGLDTVWEPIIFQPEDDGTFEIKVHGGRWILSPYLDPEYEQWFPMNPPQHVTFKTDGNDEIFDIEIPFSRPDSTLVGLITDPSDVPLNLEGTNTTISLLSLDTGYNRNLYIQSNNSKPLFAIPLLSGYYQGQILLSDLFADKFFGTDYSGPNLDNRLSVIPPGVVDLGNVKLLANNATVQGYIRDSNGLPLSSASVSFFQRQLDRQVDTDSEGYYEINLPAGAWWMVVNPEDSSQIFTERARKMTLAANTAIQIDFSPEPSGGTLLGMVMDIEGNRLTKVNDIVVHIRREGAMEPIVYGAVDNGFFDMEMPYGELRVGLHVGPDSPYFLPQEDSPELTTNSVLANHEQVALSSVGQSRDYATLQLQPTNAQVTGQLIDIDGQPIAGVSGYVVATEQGKPQNWKWSTINASGSYTVHVADGTWNLFYKLESDLSFVPHSEETTQVTVSMPIITKDLVVRKWDSFVSGIVVDEENNPVSGHPVWMRTNDYENRSRTDEDGRFVLYAPQNTLSVQTMQTPQSQALVGSHPSSRSEQGRDIHFQPGEILQVPLVPIQELDTHQTSITLTVHRTDAYLIGQVLDSRNENLPVQNARVSGVSQNGQSFTVTTDDEGCFAAPVKAGNGIHWQLTAAYGDDDSIRATANMALDSHFDLEMNQDQLFTFSLSSAFLLDYRETMSSGQAYTFSARTGAKYTLSDGFTIDIPPSSIDKDIRIELQPSATVHDTYLHTVVGYGYQIWLSDRVADQRDVLLTFPHRERSISPEDRLVVGEWVDGQWDISRLTVPIQTGSDSTGVTGYQVFIHRPGIYALLKRNKIEPIQIDMTKPVSDVQSQQRQYLPFINR